MKLKLFIATAVALSTLSAFTAQANSNANASTTFSASVAKKLNSYEDIMVGKVWVTTEALDQDNKQVDPANEQVANFFGLAEYFPVWHI